MYVHNIPHRMNWITLFKFWVETEESKDGFVFASEIFATLQHSILTDNTRRHI